MEKAAGREQIRSSRPAVSGCGLLFRGVTGKYPLMDIKGGGESYLEISIYCYIIVKKGERSAEYGYF